MREKMISPLFINRNGLHGAVSACCKNMAACCIGLVLLAGCNGSADHQSAEHEAERAAAPATSPTAERSQAGDPPFAEQVEAVRQGAAISIRARRETVGNEQLEQLTGLETLRQLNLPRGAFDDRGLAAIARLPLTQLRFHSPQVTDAGMQQIAKIETLRALHLIDVPITDEGLAHLHQMTWLESFYLDGGHCSDTGLSRLLEALPRLHFHKDQLHLPGDDKAHPH